jgi:hypothetical protein
MILAAKRREQARVLNAAWRIHDAAAESLFALLQLEFDSALACERVDAALRALELIGTTLNQIDEDEDEDDEPEGDDD